ncbi:MAG: addiction module protein [Verrucomicrobiota bacterium]
MITDAQIKEISTEEKLRVMEAIRDDLSHSGSNIPSPAWHEGTLKETEERLKNGEEEVLDWNEAKARLRQRFE